MRFNLKRPLSSLDLEELLKIHPNSKFDLELRPGSYLLVINYSLRPLSCLGDSTPTVDPDKATLKDVTVSQENNQHLRPHSVCNAVCNTITRVHGASSTPRKGRPLSHISPKRLL